MGKRHSVVNAQAAITTGTVSAPPDTPASKGVVARLVVASNGRWFEWSRTATESGPGFHSWNGHMQRLPVNSEAGSRVLERLAVVASASKPFASIAELVAAGWPDDKARPTALRTRLYTAIARDLLAGVGAGRDVESAMTFIHQLRRAVSPEEYAKLDPAWRALEPVDGGG